MASWTIFGILAPVLLIFVRRQNSPHWIVVFRYGLAFFTAWISLAFGSQAYARERATILLARGAADESMALDRVMFDSFFFGWLPSLIYVVALAWLRRLSLVLRDKNAQQASPE